MSDWWSRMEPNGHEALKATVLVVDDDPIVRNLVCRILKETNYNVLSAENGPQGLEMSRKFEGEIRVLLSDFQMPEMSGIDLASAITVDRPQLKVLLMSGFPKGLLVLNEGWHFLAKPFIASQLNSLIETLAYPDKRSRFASLENAEIGDVKSPRLSPEVARYRALQKK
jgi:DNA-binding NtrC family response regulator